MSSYSLESFLNDLFEKECKFDIAGEEEEFIQTGTETLVRKLVGMILHRLYEDKGFINIETAKENLKQSGIKFRRCTKEDVLRVGSSYEKTRNKFPDEFDFIFPVRCFEPENGITESTAKAITMFLAPTYAVSGIIAKKEETEGRLKYSDQKEQRTLWFDKVVGVAGPARKLQFIYHNENELKRIISVDLVAAAIIKGDFSNRCSNDDLKPFRDLLNKTGRVFMVKEVLTFTETEALFMREKLSENHRKVYRLLKYLINGHDDTTYKFETTKRREYSSYILKNFIIHHHCHCVESHELSQCVLSVLAEMCKHKDTGEIPMLTRTNAYNKRLKIRELFLLPYLKDLKTELNSMKDHPEEYDFEKMKSKIPKSVSTRYREEANLPPGVPDDIYVDDDDSDVLTNYED